MTQEQIEAIEQLATIDAELRELHGELEREREALAGKRQQLSELDEKLGRDQESVADMDRMRGDLTLEVRQMSQQIEKSREKLSRCRTEREANAAQREMEELRKLFRDREQEIEKLSTLIEAARVEIVTAEEQRGEIFTELGATAGQTEGRLGEVEQRAAERQTIRDGIAGRLSKLDMKLYRRYELVRKRRGTAVAVTHDGSCSACHVSMPPQQFQKLLRREEFGQCPNCARIIYFREPVEGQDAEQQSADSSPTGP